MTWCPFQVCTATFAHAMHIWAPAFGDIRYCPGIWIQSTENTDGSTT